MHHSSPLRVPRINLGSALVSAGGFYTSFTRVLRVALVPIIFCLIAILVLLLPNQTLEVLSASIEDIYSAEAWSIALPKVVALLASIFILISATFLGAHFFLHLPSSEWPSPSDPLATRIALYLPAILAVCVAFSFLWVIGRAIFRDSEVTFAAGLGIYVLLLLCSPVLFGAISCWVAWKASSGHFSLYRYDHVILASTFVMGSAAFVSHIWLSQGQVDRIVSIGALNWFIVGWATYFCLYGSARHFFQSRYDIPIGIVTVFWIALCSILGLSDNSEFRRLPAGHSDQTLDLGDGFIKWFCARKDRHEFVGPHKLCNEATQASDPLRQFARSGARYPVYIVAAEGGGQSAAFHAVTALGRLQDTCPQFAHHLFAVSGVSGGSLGAAVFSTLVEEYSDQTPGTDCFDHPKGYQGRFEELGQRFLAKDFLSPVVAAALFPDFAQRFLPVPIPRWERSLQFERAMEWAWNSVAPPVTLREAGVGPAKNPFSESYYNRWKPTSAGPALLLNVTEVESGNRIVVSPFALERSIPYLKSLAFYKSDLDLPLSTAVGLSSRFPYIASAASYKIDPKRGLPTTRHLVDGGYFENSGVETAYDLYNALTHVAAKNAIPVDIKLIAIISGSNPINQAQTFSEILSPIRTLFATRRARGALAIEHAFQEINEWDPEVFLDEARHEMAKAKTAFEGRMKMIILDTGKYRLPLGWRISTLIRRRITQGASDPECAFNDDLVTNAVDASSIARLHRSISGCSQFRIREELTRR